jgi:hypothetical protein
MTPSKAFEEGRRQAVSATRLTGDVITLPPAVDMHPHWIKGFLHYNGTFREIGQAYARWWTL